MIFDNLDNAHRYFSLSDNIKKGFEFLINSDLVNMPDGRHIIQGDEIYANVETLTTKPAKEAKWEVHRKYIDIQYVISGKEKMGYGLLNNFNKTVIPYDENKDIAFLEGEKFNFVNVDKGNFVIFFNTDVHAPMLSVENNQQIKKVIVKIKSL